MHTFDVWSKNNKRKNRKLRHSECTSRESTISDIKRYKEFLGDKDLCGNLKDCNKFMEKDSDKNNK